MSNDGKLLGAAGEEAAERFLRARGYRVLARNFSTPLGELDLVCFHEGTVVFVEVKARATDAAADPEANINPAKQRRLYRAARAWLAANRYPECAYRFDAVSIVLPKSGEPRIRHIIEAFVPEGAI